MERRIWSLEKIKYFFAKFLRNKELGLYIQCSYMWQNLQNKRLSKKCTRNGASGFGTRVVAGTETVTFQSKSAGDLPMDYRDGVVRPATLNGRVIATEGD